MLYRVRISGSLAGVQQMKSALLNLGQQVDSVNVILYKMFSRNWIPAVVVNLFENKGYGIGYGIELIKTKFGQANYPHLYLVALDEFDNALIVTYKSEQGVYKHFWKLLAVTFGLDIVLIEGSFGV